MTIKKPIKEQTVADASSAGGAAIASRLRLDAPNPAAKAGPSGGLKAAFGAALVSLVVTGLLAYMLWKHWEFLMPA